MIAIDKTTDWSFREARKDQQTISAAWENLNDNYIHGVKLKESRNVIKRNGYLREIFRQDWDAANQTVGQIFEVRLNKGGISAWHAHEWATDRICVLDGMVRLVLFDARKESPTFGQLNEFHLSHLRPTLIIIPPRIWHGVQNMMQTPTSIINSVDIPYDYENPDHWRVDQDFAGIPYTFPSID